MNGISHFGRGGLRGATEWRFVLDERHDVMLVRGIYRTLRGTGLDRVRARALIIDILFAGQFATRTRFPEAAS